LKECLILYNTLIQSLGNLEYVEGDLYLRNTLLSRLPKEELNRILDKIEIEEWVYVR
jgi:hypothetical protein